MRFVLLAQESHTLPYAVRMNESTVEAVLLKCSDIVQERKRINWRPHLLVDMEENAVWRVTGNRLAGYRLVDQGETQNIGIMTDDEWFKQFPTVDVEAREKEFEKRMAERMGSQ